MLYIKSIVNDTLIVSDSLLNEEFTLHKITPLGVYKDSDNKQYNIEMVLGHYGNYYDIEVSRALLKLVSCIDNIEIQTNSYSIAKLDKFGGYFRVGSSYMDLVDILCNPDTEIYDTYFKYVCNFGEILVRLKPNSNLIVTKCRVLGITKFIPQPMGCRTSITGGF